MEISISFEGMNTVIDYLAGMEARIKDLTPVAPKIQGAFFDFERAYLNSGGSGSFAPLKTSTLKRKNRRSSKPFDTISHAMVDTLTSNTGYSYFKVTPQSIEMGVSGGPAHWHMVARKFMPARPPIPYDERLAPLKERVGEIIVDHVMGKS